MVSIDFLNDLKPRHVEFFKRIFKDSAFNKKSEDISNDFRKTCFFSESVYAKKLSLLSNSILRNLAQSLLCLRGMTNWANIFE